MHLSVGIEEARNSRLDFDPRRASQELKPAFILATVGAVDKARPGKAVDETWSSDSLVRRGVTCRIGRLGRSVIDQSAGFGSRWSFR